MELAVYGHQSDEQDGAVQLLFDVQRDALCDAADGDGGAGVPFLGKPTVDSLQLKA